MKEERMNITNEQINYYLSEARVLRSQAISRQLGQVFRAPVQLVRRFSAFKIESARLSVQNH